MIDGTKRSEKSGFYSVFYADHTTMLNSPGTCYDAFCFLTALAMESKKIRLCTGVSDCHRFNPALMAHKIATLDIISNGRAMVGLGAGEAMNIDLYGLNRNSSYAKLREYIELLRMFWTKKRINYKSEFWGTMRNSFIQIKPIQKTPPIYVAGNSPKTRELAGEVGDGWYPFVETPWTYKENYKEVVKGAKKVDRDPSEIDYTYDCFVAIDDKNPEKTVERCDFFKTSYLVNPTKINQAYPKVNLPEDLTIHNILLDAPGAAELLSYIDKLPDTINEDLNCIGTTDDVIESIEKFKNAGATHLALMNRGPDVNKVYEIFQNKIIPYFKEQEK
jgi:alkanesulfonate monooxygenase SsuD/methylene tetrahydromethanopterin reductase-like flavin-dependent oxidoreductase (luciferase family)